MLTTLQAPTEFVIQDPRYQRLVALREKRQVLKARHSRLRLLLTQAANTLGSAAMYTAILSLEDKLEELEMQIIKHQ